MAKSTRKSKSRKVLSVKLPRSVRHMFPNVTKAVDSRVPVEVSVNKKDCDDAERLNPMNCALARAAKRELKADGVIIGMTSSYVIKGKTAYRFATPESVRREIVSFDRHSDFATGDYHLTPKSPTVQLGKNSHKKSHSNPDKTVKRKIHKSVRVRVLEQGVSY